MSGSSLKGLYTLEKLHGYENWKTWEEEILAIAQVQGLKGHLTGDIIAYKYSATGDKVTTGLTTKDEDEFQEKVDKAKGLISINCDAQPRNVWVDTDTPFGMMTKLRTKYAK